MQNTIYNQLQSLTTICNEWKKCFNNDHSEVTDNWGNWGNFSWYISERESD